MANTLKSNREEENVGWLNQVSEQEKYFTSTSWSRTKRSDISNEILEGFI